MTLQIATGSRLGPYEIVSRIGAGGMGEVWRARDTRLDRQVAIKVLPAALAENEQFRARFEREAKTISQLNHPNICTLHDVGHEKGTSYLVLELLEGESLADRLARGPLPLAEALRYGAQIAAALDRAHRAGIVHRDLKPGNVVITKSGAKLLDFGLAKSSTAPVFASADGATEHKPLTQEGTILGTFQYMAPEQLEGQEADPRTDIFSFGTLLYEMTTGRRAFQGKTKTSLMAAIVSSQPDPISSIAPVSPPLLDHVLQKCLAKDPDDRWQSAHDIMSELQWIGEAGSHTGAEFAIPQKRRLRPSWVVALALGVIGTAAVFMVLRSRQTMQRPLTRLMMPLPADGHLASYGANTIAISPSGKIIAFVAERAGVPQIFLRRLDVLDPVAIPGTEGARSIFFSSDSQWIGFLSGTHLQKVAVEGGAPQVICDAGEVRGASWQGDTIVFAMATSGVWSVPAEGGKARLVAAPGVGDDYLLAPELLPDGDTLLYSAVRPDRGVLIAMSLRNGGKTVVTNNTSSTRYLKKQGCLLFARGPSLMAAQFDPKGLRLIGSPVSVVDGIMTLQPYGRGQFAVSDDGTLVYAPGGVAQVKNSIVWVDRSGHVTPTSFPPQAYEEPRIAPSGERMAVSLRELSNADIWIGDLRQGNLTRFTFDPAEEETVAWAPDGKHVAFAASRLQLPRTIRWRLADGSGSEEQLLATQVQGGHPHIGGFSPDGGTIAYTDFGLFQGDIWVSSLASHTARPFLATAANERAPRFSPDGKYLAYTSDESGRDEIYVQSFPGPGGKWQISGDGGCEGVWASSGREIFYRNGDKMMSVDVVTGNSFSASTPHLLFSGRFVPMRRGEPGYDVNREGTKFLMVQNEQNSGPQHFVVVQNWFDDLQRHLNRGASNPQ